MDCGIAARGYRSHQFGMEGGRRSRSPLPKRGHHHTNFLRRDNHYGNHENDSHSIVKDLSRHPSFISDAQKLSDLGDTDALDMMTFRTFIITNVDEMCDPSTAIKAYEEYKKNFKKKYILEIHWAFRDLPLIAERYDQKMQLRQFEATSQQCHLEASRFIKLLMEERFFGIAFVDRFSSPRSCLDSPLPFQLNVGQSLVNNDLFSSSLRAPFWFPPDPDEGCLCWKNIPSTLSKWDILDHLTTIGATEGLQDITLLLSNDSKLVYPACKSLASTIYRDAWIKYTSEEAAASAETKMDGTRCRDTVCRPVRRVPNVANYTLRVTPSEACHPVRILRDLHISARLIEKLDKEYGVCEVISNNVHDMEKDTTELNGSETGTDTQFLSSCSSHPVLCELCNVLNNSGGRTAEEQLDIQLLYLRLVHNVCYYSARKFNSQRELWATCGPLYVRPCLMDTVDLNVALPGFTSDHSDMDKSYMEGADIWVHGRMKEQHELVKRDEDNEMEDINENHKTKNNSSLLVNHEKLFLPQIIKKGFFEPQSVLEVHGFTKHEEDEEEKTFTNVSMSPSNATTNVKVEDAMSLHSPNTTTEEMHDVFFDKLSTDNVTNSKKHGANFTSTTIPIPRGRFSPWLETLDARLTFLFMKKNPPSSINENSAEFETEWNAFCTANIKNSYDENSTMERWSCPSCSKQFKGFQYVKNHLRHKHPTCVQDCIDRAYDRYLYRQIVEDPYKIPVVLPSPTPYLYRLKNVRAHRRQEPHYSSHNPLHLMNSSRTMAFDAPMNTTFANYNALHKMGGYSGFNHERSYRDWDAPTSTTTAPAQGNFRTCVLYDDL